MSKTQRFIAVFTATLIYTVFLAGLATIVLVKLEEIKERYVIVERSSIEASNEP